MDMDIYGDMNKKQNFILEDIFPIELIRIIKKYIPIPILVYLNKYYYLKYHYSIKRYIIKDQFENYVRNIIKRDYSLVFSQIFKENVKKWILLKKYNYKNNIYSNYIYFLLDLCLENESTNCQNIIKKYLKESGLSKNQHKKNTIINIRGQWTI
jgi:hypothetical protein